jgi:hypothetical protein
MLRERGGIPRVNPPLRSPRLPRHSAISITLKTLTIYDPPMCCSSGVCGPDVDPALVQFSGFLAQLEQRGIEVRRFNLAHEPLEFVRNPAVKTALEREGTEALPLIFIDGHLARRGGYPDHDERIAWAAAARDGTPVGPV